jgi:hypothetical protein
MVCVPKAPLGNRHWEDPSAATGCFFVRTVLTGQSSEPSARKLCAAAVLPALLCAADLSHVILQDLPHQWVFRHASARHQDIHIPHPHTRLVSLPESTYIIAFFHLPHPSCCKFLPRLSRSGFGANPGHRNPDTSALFD